MYFKMKANGIHKKYMKILINTKIINSETNFIHLVHLDSLPLRIIRQLQHLSHPLLLGCSDFWQLFPSFSSNVGVYLVSIDYSLHTAKFTPFAAMLTSTYWQ